MRMVLYESVYPTMLRPILLVLLLLGSTLLPQDLDHMARGLIVVVLLYTLSRWSSLLTRDLRLA